MQLVFFYNGCIRNILTIGHYPCPFSFPDYVSLYFVTLVLYKYTVVVAMSIAELGSALLEKVDQLL